MTRGVGCSRIRLAFIGHLFQWATVSTYPEGWRGVSIDLILATWIDKDPCV